MIKNDIEKMKREFAEKLRIAEEENRLNEGINEYQISLMGNNRLWVNMPYKPCVGFEQPTIKHFKDVFEKFPRTDDIEYNSVKVPYVCYSSCGYNDTPKLTIKWKHNDYTIDISLKINKELIDNFFIIGSRDTTSSENSTYTSIHYNGNHSAKVNVYYFKNENGSRIGVEQISYQGGNNYLIDVNEITRLINFLTQ